MIKWFRLHSFLQVKFKKKNNSNRALTKHFSVLCILCHNVQHVFGLHDLRERNGAKRVSTNWVMGNWWCWRGIHFFFHKSFSAPGSSGHETFSDHKTPFSYFPINLFHTHQHRGFPWYTLLHNPAVSDFLHAFIACFKYKQTQTLKGNT